MYACTNNAAELVTCGAQLHCGCIQMNKRGQNNLWGINHLVLGFVNYKEVKNTQKQPSYTSFIANLYLPS